MSLKSSLLLIFLLGVFACQLPRYAAIADQDNYLRELQEEFTRAWPDSRTINLVFHGHSVPIGYFKTPAVHTLEAYPHLLLRQLKSAYPRAIINIITTSIGGEDAEQGSKRLRDEVMNHRPDVLFIDYALNDRRIELERAKKAWERMIVHARRKGVPVILLTPTPDQKENLFDSGGTLQQHADQIRALATTHGVGLVDSYAAFQRAVKAGDSLDSLMAQGNHPDARGHELVAKELGKYFGVNR